MRVQHPKDYLVLAYDTEAEDILLFIIRDVFTRNEAIKRVKQEYDVQEWDKPTKIRAINMNSKSIFLCRANIHDLPSPIKPDVKYNYTPQVEYV